MAMEILEKESDIAIAFCQDIVWGRGVRILSPYIDSIPSVEFILGIEGNALFGKLGPMKSVKGVIHCGLALAVVLYLSVILTIS